MVEPTTFTTPKVMTPCFFARRIYLIIFVITKVKQERIESRAKNKTWKNAQSEWNNNYLKTAAVPLAMFHSVRILKNT